MTIVNYEDDVEHMEDRIEKLIRKHESFDIVNVKRGQQSTVVEVVESAIESCDMKCRVRTNCRGVAAAGLTLVTLGWGAAAFGAIAAHDIATINPDYEVIKDMIGSGVRVKYCK